MNLDMDPTRGFVLFLALTLAALGVTVASGLRRKLRVHIPAVVTAVAMLGVTIYYAEQLGRLYDLKSVGWITPLHLTLAKTTTLAYLWPVVTGVRTWRDRRRRPAHRLAAFSVLGLTVLTAVTGTAMILMAERLPVEP